MQYLFLKFLCEQIKNNIGMSLLWSFQNGLDSHGGDHGMTSRNSTVVQNNTPRPVYYVYYYINKFLGDKLVFSYSNDPDINCMFLHFLAEKLEWLLSTHLHLIKL